MTADPSVVLRRPPSLASSNYSWSRCCVGHCSYLLSLDLPAASKDIFTLLGFFLTERRGPSDWHLEGELRFLVTREMHCVYRFALFFFEKAATDVMFQRDRSTPLCS